MTKHLKVLISQVFTIMKFKCSVFIKKLNRLLYHGSKYQNYNIQYFLQYILFLYFF
jgi:hypothetical protein